jgi:hypothetical protein
MLLNNLTHALVKIIRLFKAELRGRSLVVMNEPEPYRNAVNTPTKYCTGQCCGSETFHYGSGSDFSMSSGSASYSQKVPVSDPTFFLTKYDFKSHKMTFQNIILKNT